MCNDGVMEVNFYNSRGAREIMPVSIIYFLTR